MSPVIMKIAKLLFGLILLASGLALLGVSIQQSIASGNWNWLWIGLLGFLVSLAGLEITMGGSVKGTLKEYFSGLMWWS